MKKLYISLIWILLLLISCQQKMDMKSEIAEVNKVIDQFYHLYETQNMELFTNLIADDDDMVNFGTDSVEYWVGLSPLKESLRNQWIAFEEPEITLENLVIKISESGTVAWYSLFINLRVKFKGETAEWKGARSTGVLEKRNGKWFIVQFHNSMPQIARVAEY